MPLESKTLQAELVGVLSIYNVTSVIPAMQMAKAIGTYWNTGTSAGKNVCLNALSKVSTIGSELSSIFSSYNVSYMIPATKIAKCIDDNAKSLMFAGICGSGIILTTQKQLLVTDLASWLMDMYCISPVLSAVKLTKAIDSYSKNIIISDSGIPPGVPPVIGPLS